MAVGVAAATALNLAWSRLYLTLKFGGLRAVFLSLWASISAPGIAAFSAVRVAALSAFSAVRVAAIGTFAAIKGLTLAGMWAGVKAAGVAAFFAIKGAAVAAFGALATVGLPVLAVIAAISAVAAILIAAWKPLSTFFQGFADGLSREWIRVEGATERLLNALGPVGDGFRWLWDIGKGVFSWLADAFGIQEDAGRSWAQAFVDVIVWVIDKLIEFSGWWESLFSLISDGDWFAAGAKVFGTLIDGMKSMIGGVYDTVKSVFSGIRDLLPFSDARRVHCPASRRRAAPS